MEVDGAREKINAVYNTTLKINDNVLKSEDLKYELNVAEQYTMSAILGEYDAHGKPKFANAESRTAELCFRLNNNEKYTNLVKNIKELRKENLLLNADLQRDTNILEVFFK